MPPRTIPTRPRGRGKGKEKETVGSSHQSPPTSEIPPSALSILHPAIAAEFEESFKARLVMKPHIFHQPDALSLPIPMMLLIC